MRQPFKSILVAASGLALVGTMAAAPTQARHHDDPEVIAWGLVGPLSLDVGKGKDLYVTQNFMGVLSKIDPGLGR
ncbi:hypothetical protein [Ornithinimicrobium sufpigmenti]|uniref:hypothetical protein n=1 Tax=Ornithinimicrobium sufpigmenti TaxID=2508882 RepID=UPI001036DD3B|nr:MULTISPECIES: hypothetical protein [unclassified Ornithinimicrobium]